MFCFQTVFVFSQDPTFSQFYTAGLYLNPAIIALEKTTTLTAHTRTQWKSIGANFQTSQLAVMAPISRKEKIDGYFGGVGVSAFQDKANNGASSNSGVNLSFSTNVKMTSKSQLTLGLQGGFIQKNVSPTSFQWTSQYNPYLGYDSSIDPGVSTIETKVTYPDLSAGILYYYNYKEDLMVSKMDGYVGLSAYHLNQPNESFVVNSESKLPVLYKLHGGMDIQLNYKFTINPNVLAALQGGNLQLNLGSYFNYSFAPLIDRLSPTFITFGGWYRVKDAYIVSAGLGGSYYTIAFSYDMNSSSLRQTFGANVSAYEISLKLKQPAIKIRTHQTPRM